MARRRQPAEPNRHRRSQWRLPRELYENDPVARSLIRDAASAFEDTKADRDLLKRTKREAARLAEEFLNLFIAGDLNATDADSIRTELSKLRVVRRLTDSSKELLDVYRCMEIIRDCTSRSVELDYPQAMADPLLLRAFSTEAIRAVGEAKGVDVGPLTDLMERAYKGLGMTQWSQDPDVVLGYAKVSEPLMVGYHAVNATKVYFMGPLFYANARNRWTLTFSTGSGLPDPLEWNGSSWFSQRYGVPMERLTGMGVGAKNPFRALNFSAGICNPRWPCHRVYVWQHSKTSRQLQMAYALAHAAGQGAAFLREAVRQLGQVFRTPNLKILSLDTFSDPLKAWTRLSPRDAMVSCRPGTAEERIAHGVWLRPGIRLSEKAGRTLPQMLGALTNILLRSTPQLAAALGVLAVGGATYLLAGEEPGRKQASVLRNLRKDLDRVHAKLWEKRRIPGTVKEAHGYAKVEAVAAALRTLSALLEIPYGQLLAVHNGSPDVPLPKLTPTPVSPVSPPA